MKTPHFRLTTKGRVEYNVLVVTLGALPRAVLYECAGGTTTALDIVRSVRRRSPYEHLSEKFIAKALAALIHEDLVEAVLL